MGFKLAGSGIDADLGRADLAGSGGNPKAAGKADAGGNPNSPRPSRFRKLLDSKLTTALVLLVGVAFLLYPVLSTLQNNYEQAEIVRKTWKPLNKANSEVLEQELARAEAYNQQLGFGPIFDPFLEEAVPDSPEYRRYSQQLNLHEEMGAISIPKANILLPIYHGTSDEVLAKGVGHLFGSSLPVGGKDTETILTGHSGLSSASMFDNLRDLGKGDEVYLLVQGRKLKYRVSGTKVVWPEDTRALKNIAGQDKLVLITCTPYGINTHRLLVFADRAELSEQEEQALDQPPQITPWQNWMIISLAITLGSVFGFFFLARKKKQPKDQEATALAVLPDRESNPSPAQMRWNPRKTSKIQPIKTQLGENPAD